MIIQKVSPPLGNSFAIVSDCFSDDRSYRRSLLTGRVVYANILWSLGRYAVEPGVMPRQAKYGFGDIGSASGPALSIGKGDHVMIAPFYRRWANNVHGLASCLEAIRERSPASITLLDVADQPGSPYLSLLPLVDRLLKGQLARDRGLYHSSECGGAAFADWCQRTHGWTTGPLAFQSQADAAEIHKIQLGWTFGGVPFFSRLRTVARLLSRPLERRRTQLHARFSAMPVGPADSPDYYTRYRSLSADAVRRLPGSIRKTDPVLVNRWQFYRELFDSQIVFSPFGWGEVCIRDFEAAAAGCVLLKPDMSHLDTRPAIYQENVTYVPVRWDLADLPARIDWILTNPRRAAEIAGNLQRTYNRELKTLS